MPFKRSLKILLLSLTFLVGCGTKTPLHSYSSKKLINEFDPLASLSDGTLEKIEQEVDKEANILRESSNSRFESIKKSAQSGDPKAQAIMSVHYSLGWNVPENKEMALKYAKDSTEKGNSLGKFYYGKFLKENKHITPEAEALSNKYLGEALEYWASHLEGKEPYEAVAYAYVLAEVLERESGSFSTDDVNKVIGIMERMIKKASDNDCAVAQFAYFKFYGDVNLAKHLKLTRDEAYKYRSRAIELGFPPALMTTTIDALNKNRQEKPYLIWLNNVKEQSARGDSNAKGILAYLVQEKSVFGGMDLAYSLAEESSKIGSPIGKLTLSRYYNNKNNSLYDLAKANKLRQEALSGMQSSADSGDSLTNAFTYSCIGDAYSDLGDISNGLVAVRKAIALGSPKAEFSLWQRYSEGQGVIQDKEKGYEYLKKSASQGYKPAQVALASDSSNTDAKISIFKTILLVDQDADVASEIARLSLLNFLRDYEDKEKAFEFWADFKKYYMLAADYGNIEYQTNLANYFRGQSLYDGKLTWEVSPKKALKYATLSSRNGEVKGIILLGKLYYDGFGCEENQEEAIKLWSMALKMSVLNDQNYHIAKKYLEQLGKSDIVSKIRNETQISNEAQIKIDAQISNEAQIKNLREATYNQLSKIPPSVKNEAPTRPEVQIKKEPQLQEPLEATAGDSTSDSDEMVEMVMGNAVLIGFFLILIVGIAMGSGDNRSIIVFRDYDDLGLTFLIPASFILIGSLFFHFGGYPILGFIFAGLVSAWLSYILAMNTYQDNQKDIPKTLLALATKLPLAIIWIYYLLEVLNPKGNSAQRREKRAKALVILTILTPIIGMLVVNKSGSCFNPKGWIRGRRVGSIIRNSL